MPVFYNLTLQPATAITHAVLGSFSSSRTQEIAVSHGSTLELIRPDSQGNLTTIISTQVFGIIRSLATFRFTGSTRDYIVIGSDSGKLVIAEFKEQSNSFVQVHAETFGKTGVRRIVPGQYIAVDPKGRALMIGAVERQKFVYVLNRDSETRLTISSPLEAHKSHVICHGICGIDVGFQNPLFVSIEQSYEQIDKNPALDAALPPKVLAWWEMDLGLNHVVKKLTMAIDASAHTVVPVPGSGGADGPSGIILCCENYIVYKKPDHEDVACAMPRRLETAQDKGLMIVCYAVHKMKDFFFILLQSELGDLYKIDIRHSDGVVSEIQCRYFDTIPCANAICVLKSGHLFVASDFSNHLFYQFTGIGTDESDPLCTSAHSLGKNAIVAFKPRALHNLSLCDELYSLSPITDMLVFDAVSAGWAQLFLACGRGPRSSIRVLQHGIPVEEMADNILPGRPRSVWTIKDKHDSDYDGYIIVSFEGNTLVLSIGDTVEELTETPFITNVTSLHVAVLYDDSFIQIHELGIRHMSDGRIFEWKSPNGKRVLCGTSNSRQVVVGLSGGELILFQLDDSMNINEIAKRELGSEITCVALQPVPKDRLRASFMAVGGFDCTVRVLSLEKDADLRVLASQPLPNNTSPESLAIVCMEGNTGSKAYDASRINLTLNIGLSNGILIRCNFDPVTGALSDQRSRFLGAKAVNLVPVRIGNGSGLMALSDRSYICFLQQFKYTCLPLNYDPLQSVASFTSEQCAEGFVAICENSLRIFACNKLTDTFSQHIIPISFTPRAMALLPHANTVLLQSGVNSLLGQNGFYMQGGPLLAVVEADHGVYDEKTKDEIRQAFRQIRLNNELNDENTDENNDLQEPLSEQQIGTFKAGEGKWGSCLRLINPASATTVSVIHMNTDEAAISICACELEGLPCLVIGTTFGMMLKPRQVSAASIRVYTYDVGFNLTLLHTTPVEDVPYAFAPFHSRLLVSVGNKLRIYSLGKQRLLRKCEYKNLPECITKIQVIEDRIFVADYRESWHVMRYRPTDNTLYVLCDDSRPRWVTTGEVLDYHTIISADKFDSIFVNRVPSEANVDEVGDLTGLKLKGDTAYLTGKTHKFNHVVQFHLGDTVMALKKAVLFPGGSECILYATILGAIGALLPFPLKEEMDFCHHLEMIMRNECPPFAGNDHLSYRSYYHPVQNVIDGDLCEKFSTLTPERQKAIATELDRPATEILKKLESIRNRVL